MKTVSDKSADGLSRRRFLAKTSALGAASLLGIPLAVAAEPPPETQRIRLVHSPAICFAPQYIAEELLHLEGFTEVEYVKIVTNWSTDALGNGEADFSMEASPTLVHRLDAGKPVVAVAGIHAGCYELFGNDRGQAIHDLKDRDIAISALGGADHVLLASMLAYVGIDPHKDVTWVTGQTIVAMELFATGKADAFMGFPPQPQEFARGKSGMSL